MPIRSGMRLDVPILSIQLCWYSTMQKNRHYKEAARREEPLQMRRQKKNHSNYSNTNEFMFCKQILGRDYKV